MRYVWAMCAVLAVAGMMGGCDSSSKNWNRGSGSTVAPSAAPVAAEPAPAAPAAGAPVLPPETTEAAPPVMEVSGAKARTGSKPAGKAEAKADSGGAGQVVSVAEAKRVTGHYYLTIVAVKSEEMARKDAQFLARHGVSSTVEKSSKGLYVVRSVQGFATLDAAAKAFKAKVLAVGKEFPGSKAGKGAWDDAYFSKKAVGTTVTAATAKKSATPKPAG